MISDLKRTISGLLESEVSLTSEEEAVSAVNYSIALRISKLSTQSKEEIIKDRDIFLEQFAQLPDGIQTICRPRKEMYIRLLNKMIGYEPPRNGF